MVKVQPTTIDLAEVVAAACAQDNESDGAQAGELARRLSSQLHSNDATRRRRQSGRRGGRSC